jgi:type I restriction enzyme S subunit
VTDGNNLIADHLDIWTSAVENRTGAGRGVRGGTSLCGVKKLRQLILRLAVRGKLVPQDPTETSAIDLAADYKTKKVNAVKERRFKNQIVSRDSLEDDTPFELPANWSWVRLGDIGFIYNGNSVSAGAKATKYNNPDDLPYLATKDIGYGFDPINYKVDTWIPAGEPKFVTALPNTALICSEGGSAGKKCGLTNKTVCFGNKLYACQPYGDFDSKYLLTYYQTDDFYIRFSSRMAGIIGGVSIGNFINIPVPLPPLAEQYRIMAKVDELMQICDALEAQMDAKLKNHEALVKCSLTNFADSTSRKEQLENWQRIEVNFSDLIRTEGSVDVLKDAILQFLFAGQISSECKCENSTSKLSNFEYIPLGKLLEDQRDISYGVIKLGAEPQTGGVPTLRCSDVKPGRIVEAGIRKVSEEIEKDYLRTKLQGGEVVLNIRGTLGGVAKVPLEMKGFNVAREVAVIPVGDRVDPDYLVYFLRSPIFWKYLEENLRGIAYKGLNLGILRRLEIPIPNKKEQIEIVEIIDNMFDICDKLQELFNYSNNLALSLADSLTERVLAGD